MSEHTKGRLAVNYDWIVPADHANRPIGSSTDKNRDRECYAHVVAFTHSKYHDQAANARRLVACWNMFPDIDTDVIEVMPTFTEFQQANDEELRAVLHELNAARADLETARKRDEEWHDHTTRKAFELSEAIFERDAARALLREALESGLSVMPVDFSRNPLSLESRVSHYLDACDKPGEPDAS